MKKINFVKNLILSLFQSLKRGYKWYRNEVFHPEQEASLEIKQLVNEDLSFSYEWQDTGSSFAMWITLFGTLVVLVGGVYSLFEHPEDTKVLLGLIGTFVFLMLPAIFGSRDNAKLIMKRMFLDFWSKEEIQKLRKKHKYFYIRERKIVFTNVKPFFFLCNHRRWSTDLECKSFRRNPVIRLMHYLVFSTLYLRLAWPYFFNPIQLAFREYDYASKKIELRQGQRVLVLGAGSVPHHVRWKRLLGSEGKIVALDLDKYVLKDSKKWERLIEWVRSKCGKCRWMSQYIVANSSEIPFVEDSFDVVIAIRCYSVNVREVLRVLKQGGKFIIITCGDVHFLEEVENLERIPKGWIVSQLS